MNQKTICTFVLAGSLVVAASRIASAGDFQGDWSYQLGYTNVGFHLIDQNNNNTVQNLVTTQFHAVRTGGTDTLAPNVFNAYCVEIGETLGQGAASHPDVFNLLGSSTNTGGITGPIFFDAVKTARLETLWGTFAGSVVDGNSSAAFQLAQWELAFDTDATLAKGGKLYIDGQDIAGITDVAEGWLKDIRLGNATTRQSLILLSGPSIQDQIAPVPEPASFLAVGLGLVGVIARRRRK